MNDQQRTQLLDEVYKSSGTVGRSIPKSVRIEDEMIPVREFYFRVSEGDLKDEDRETVEEVLSYLRRKRLTQVQQIEDGEISFETGKALVPKIRDLDRTINALESLDDPDFSEQVRRKRIESARELIDLMREFDRI